MEEGEEQRCGGGENRDRERITGISTEWERAAQGERLRVNKTKNRRFKECGSERTTKKLKRRKRKQKQGRKGNMTHEHRLSR